MHEAVLMDDNIYEGTELGDIGNNSFQLHTGPKIGEFADALLEAGSHELGARVAAGLRQFFQDVSYSVGAGRQSAPVHLLEQLRFLNQAFRGDAKQFGDLLHDGVGLRVYGGHVEGIVAAADAEESGGLFERFRTYTGHGLELDARAEPA